MWTMMSESHFASVVHAVCEICHIPVWERRSIQVRSTSCWRYFMFPELTTICSKQKPRIVISCKYGMFEVSKYVTIQLLTFELLNVESTCCSSFITPEQIERYYGFSLTPRGRKHGRRQTPPWLCHGSYVLCPRLMLARCRPDKINSRFGAGVNNK